MSWLKPAVPVVVVFILTSGFAEVAVVISSASREPEAEPNGFFGLTRIYDIPRNGDRVTRDVDDDDDDEEPNILCPRPRSATESTPNQPLKVFKTINNPSPTSSYPDVTDERNNDTRTAAEDYEAPEYGEYRPRQQHDDDYNTMINIAITGLENCMQKTLGGTKNSEGTLTTDSQHREPEIPTNSQHREPEVPTNSRHREPEVPTNSQHREPEVPTNSYHRPTDTIDGSPDDSNTLKANENDENSPTNQQNPEDVEFSYDYSQAILPHNYANSGED